MSNLFKTFDDEFHFTLDAAADASNAKCKSYFTKEDNALEMEWGRGPIWCNPPGNEDPEPWVRKAINAAEKGATVVMLLRPGLNKTWFHLCLRHGQVRFIGGNDFACAECGQHIEFCAVIFGGWHERFTNAQSPGGKQRRTLDEVSGFGPANTILTFARDG